MNLWLYLHFPRLQLDSLYQQNHRSATVIVDGQKNTIVQLNKTALSEGLSQGMGMATAASLCHHLHVHPYQEDIEKEKLQEIAHWLYLVTSDITLFEPDGILLRITYMLTLYDGLDNYWQELKKHLESLSVDYHYATAYSPLAAQLLARTAVNQITNNQEDIDNQLNVLPLSSTPISVKNIDKLKRLGVSHISALLKLPLTELAKRFDIQLVNYVGKLTGQFKDPISFYQPPGQFKRRLELLYDIAQLQRLERPLLLLLAKLEAFLVLRDQIAHQLTIVLHQRDATDVELIIDSAQGDYKANRWLSLAQLTLESIKIDGPIHSITISVARSLAKQAASDDMFLGKKGHHNGLDLISTLQAKLGKQAVTGITLSEDIRPEFATQVCEPLAKYIAPKAVETKLRPSILLPTPQRLYDKVTIMQGPERLATGWWDGRPVVRDYFIARCLQGRWLWVFRTPENEWFLHGLFS